MKKVLLIILREIGITFLILILLLAITVVAFKDKVPFDDVVPSGEQYVRANMKTYSVSSTDRLSEVEAITITHETNNRQIIDAENQVRIQTGKYTPFGTISSTTDLPSERVGVTIDPSLLENNDDSNDNSDNTKEELDYPETGDLVKEIETDQNETSESAANRRMGNVE